MKANAFGVKIRELEELYLGRGLTQKDFAKSLGVSSRTIRRYKNREDPPDPETGRRAGLLRNPAERALDKYTPPPDQGAGAVRSLANVYEGRGFSQKNIAEAMGVSKSTLYRLKRGATITKRTAVKLGLTIRGGEYQKTILGVSNISKNINFGEERGVYAWKPKKEGLVWGAGMADDEDSANIRDRANTGLREAIRTLTPIRFKMRFLKDDGITEFFKFVTLNQYISEADFWSQLYQKSKEFLEGDSGYSVTIAPA